MVISLLSIIIPTYMEGMNICSLLSRIEEVMQSYDFEILVVDDDSPDGTAEQARKCGENYGNVRVYVRKGVKDLGSAIIYGFKKASGDVLAVMDADFQHPPELLPVMYEKVLEDADIVVASRYVEGGSVEGWSFYRKLCSRIAILIFHFLFPSLRFVKDPVSGFFVVKRSVIQGVDLNPIGFKVLVEILVKGKYRKLVEVPFVFSSRKAGSSKLGLGTILRYLYHVLLLRLKL